jgi:hypothetical protein
MAAHPSSVLAASELVAAAPDAGGFERGIARRMPTLMVGAVGVLLILWWMAAQPPPGPGWGNPNEPQQPWPQQGQGQPYNQGQPQRVPPPNTPSSGCSACSGLDCTDCLAGIECADCLSGLDCGDCLSGLDCTCAVSGAPATAATGATAAKPGRACSTNPWKRLAGSWGLLLPLFVMIGWRRRLRR